MTQFQALSIICLLGALVLIGAMNTISLTRELRVVRVILDGLYEQTERMRLLIEHGTFK